jgi:vitamin B12 transporter
MVFKGYSLKLAYTQQKPINTTLNIEQARRAKNFGSFEMKRDFDATSMGVKFIWSGSRRDSDFTEQRLPSYAVGNFFLSRKLDSNWRFRLLIENFTDEKYEIASGYNTPRRGVFLTLQYQ